MKVGKKYVYSAEQANFYLQHGATPIEIGTGSKGDTYVVFNYDDHVKILPKWVETIHNWSKAKATN